LIGGRGRGHLIFAFLLTRLPCGDILLELRKLRFQRLDSRPYILAFTDAGLDLGQSLLELLDLLVVVRLSEDGGALS
jgi:hypothetical protein